MIYLIDDKKKRQANDYGWDEDKITSYKNSLVVIYNINELINASSNVFKSGNTVIYHESFLDFSPDSSLAVEKRKKLEDFASKNSQFKLVIFSGSKFNRQLSNNVAHIPVSNLYQNLGKFIEEASSGNIDLKYLLFGNNPKIEDWLSNQLDYSLAKLEFEPALIPNQRTLFLRTPKRYIHNAIKDSEEKILFNIDVSEAKLTEYIYDWLDEVKYDNIFVPLCFGSTLSDFNGLRFASHIRCTETENQLTNIYIYSFVDLKHILNHECFNILKTKNVTLVPFQKSSFQIACLNNNDELTIDELPKQIQKLDLKIPTDFDDNHAINNEWALYNWIWALPQTFYDKVKKVLNNVDNRLYFKYLQTMSSTVFKTVKEDHLKLINKNGRVLFVDNDYDKGWKVIFEYILNVCNNLHCDTLQIDFKTLSREEIIENAYNKIVNQRTKELNYDVIILDYRLCTADNDESNIDSITGMQILRRLKAFNSGLQVIIFSATNKIWNLEALIRAGADQFVIKEGIGDQSSGDNSKDSISHFLKVVDLSLERKFLKDYVVKLKTIKNALKTALLEAVEDYEEFLEELLSFVRILNLSISNIDLQNPSTIDVAYLNFYNFLEKFKNYYLKKDGYQYVLGINELDLKEYLNRNGNTRFNPDNNRVNIKASFFEVLAALNIDYFENCSIDSVHIQNLGYIKDWRNNYIHNNKNSFIISELSVIIDIAELTTRKIKE